MILSVQAIAFLRIRMWNRILARLARDSLMTELLRNFIQTSAAARPIGETQRKRMKARNNRTNHGKPKLASVRCRDVHQQHAIAETLKGSRDHLQIAPRVARREVAELIEFDAFLGGE